jgi:hypothetical protein
MTVCINNTSFLVVHCKWAALSDLYVLAIAAELRQTPIVWSSSQ